jgi:hypothetical protein
MSPGIHFAILYSLAGRYIITARQAENRFLSPLKKVYKFGRHLICKPLGTFRALGIDFHTGGTGPQKLILWIEFLGSHLQIEALSWYSERNSIMTWSVKSRPLLPGQIHDYLSGKDQITIKTPNPKCRPSWCSIEFMYRNVPICTVQIPPDF